MKKYNLKNIIPLLLLFIVASSCSDDDSAFGGKDNFITSFQLEQEGSVFTGVISTGNEIVINVSENRSLKGAKATLVISENAKVSPDPSSITNWDETQTFVIRSHNGTEKTYTYIVQHGIVSRDGDVTLRTQSDVDALASMQLNEINGSLTIGTTSGTDSIHSLASLSSLKHIRFDLVINPNYAGKTFEGLEGLEKVGALKIVSSSTLEEINLPQLKTIVSGLRLERVSKLKKVSLPQLVSIDRALYLENADLLTAIDLPKLETVVEDVTIKGGYDANILTDINLSSLKSVGGDMVISNWKILPELLLPKLQKVSTLHILSLEKVEKVSLPALVFVSSECRVVYNLALKNLDISSLESVAGKFNLENLNITTLDGFKALKSVGGEVQLANLNNLKSTKGINSLRSIGGRLYLSYLAAVEDNLEGFSLVNHIGGDVLISGVSFSKFSGFSLKEANSIGIYATGLSSIEEIDLTNVKVSKSISLQDIATPFTLKGPKVFDGELRIDGNTPKRIEGFEEVGTLACYITNGDTKERSFNVSKVKGDLIISIYSFDKFSMPNLVDVGGKLTLSVSSDNLTVELPKLKTAGSLEVGSPKIGKLSLPALESINGNCNIVTANYMGTLKEIKLPMLKKINGTLDLSGYSDYYTNKELKNLDGLSSLTSVQGITIQYNEALVDFSGLKNALSSFTAETWKVLYNAYNPTYQNMKDGNWKKP